MIDTEWHIIIQRLSTTCGHTLNPQTWNKLTNCTSKAQLRNMRKKASKWENHVMPPTLCGAILLTTAVLQVHYCTARYRTVHPWIHYCVATLLYGTVLFRTVLYPRILAICKIYKYGTVRYGNVPYRNERHRFGMVPYRTVRYLYRCRTVR